MMETNSPSLMSTLMRRSTNVRLAPWAYDFSILRSEMSASGAGVSDGWTGAGCAADDRNSAMLSL
jgi:hypothetical protein